MTSSLDWFFGEAEEMFRRTPLASGRPLAEVGLVPDAVSAVVAAAEAEGWPLTIEGAPAGREIARKFREVGSEWEVLEEPHALRLLACSSRDVPALLERMEKGETFRTRFAEYRLVK